MLKTIANVRLEVIDSQQIEIGYKGNLNTNLYIVCIDTLGKISKKTHWKYLDENLFNSIINSSIASPITNRVYITNQYEDWIVDAYIK